VLTYLLTYLLTLPQAHMTFVSTVWFRNFELVGLSHGSIYTMATVWERYCEMLQTDIDVLVDKCDRDDRTNFQKKIKR